ncbi:MAG: pilus assembly protein PilB [Ignavibacteria bacterium GWA2_55_11]|nr:MAG: pilus assembly protein PilB [Ignavibacteria bacterium GWA2_55_11]OGU45685.1 MAG: pilus assembly protein PilB [Ignavibacteria bacterium GWC2_56_12]OGU67413.1 MAG: pilus assembly protein PilB [Ignavibacteria bacterium RIFCSPHIGHO2_02_FULL_56_12]OGU70719.1 MAG: pilus assembly protein PilB [Ignavibacteria bacterium RIFCSPLOWO2_12_FULL_56_21]
MPEIDITDKIGYTLLKKGIIDFETLEKSLKHKDSEENKKNRKNLGQILVSEFGADHDAVFREVANLYAFREIFLNDEKIDEARTAFIKKFIDALSDQQREMMSAAKMLPFKWDERQTDKLIIVAADPTDRNLPVVARSFNVKKYEICYVRLKDLQNLLEKVAPKQNEFLKMLEGSETIEEGGGKDDVEVDEDALEAEINKSALVNLFEGCIVEAVRRDVSDVHIVAAEGNRTNFMFRVDGNLQVWHCQEATLPEAVMAVIKDRTKNVDRFEREASQDGFIQRIVDGHQLRFRVSIMPIVTTEFKHKFESVVIRVLDDRKVITDLNKLGLQGPAKNFFYKAIAKPQGIIILTGPTGSGKSTTLIAALYQVIDPTVNVLTIEEPVEYIIKGARQLKIGPKMGFEQAIRGILRHDPDIVLVGEMRDKVTAETAIKLANTGHLVFSTLHTNDAPSAVARLYKMGIEPFLIAYAINIIVAQRLIRTLCKVCKAPVDEPDKADLLKFGFTEEDLTQHTFYKPVGCDKCNGGWKGRAAIHEALFFSKAIKDIVLNAGDKVDENAIREQAAKDGMWTLRRSGMERMKEGMTALEEVIASTVEED